MGSHGAVVGWPIVIPGEIPRVGIPLHKSRKTLTYIRREKIFTLNLVRDWRALEVFGKPGVDKLARWGNVAPCRLLKCNALGDASRVAECIYRGEVEVGEHVIVFCDVVLSYGCGEYIMWDPCRQPPEG